ncbi:MAG TPA: hypothetical protein VKR21_16675 [Solirubrobacteraceae bacterium]|nr:hypothetical protein [Solirubrobacteraceae bacterium]
MNVPVEEIIHRGRVVRARRRAFRLIPLAAAMFVAIALLASSHPSNRSDQGIHLAAWTVVKHTDGTVAVTIRELRDPAGLQRKLRADGVPASVIFGNQSNPCQSYGHPELLSNVVTPSTAPGQPQGAAIVMVLHPSALPSAAGVQIITNQTRVGIHLVSASHGCTS